ncbi:MAG TPA: ATP-binding cassette domain-containing protein [Candidatus Elarobacter sp.]|jgi:phosphonate transport system ATP-binding protein
MTAMAALEAPLLDVHDLGMRFPNGHQALRGVSLALRGGEFVVILGSNGSGKSTLLRCIARLLDPTAGSIEVAGEDLSRLSGTSLRRARCRVAFVSQQAILVRRRSVLANVATGTLGRHESLATSLGFLPAEALPCAYEQLRVVGLRDRAMQRAGTLSGGQSQRVAIARALAQQPRVLLADEPVASLDPEAALDVLALLRSLAGGGLGVLCVLHQPDLAVQFADRVIGIRHGSLAFDLPASALSPSIVAALYAGEAA